MKVVYGLFLILNIQVFFMYSASIEDSVIRRFRIPINQSDLPGTITIFVKKCAEEQSFNFSDNQIARIVQGYHFGIKKLKLETQIIILVGMDLELIAKRLGVIKEERSEI